MTRTPPPPGPVLTVAEMRGADQAAIAAGRSGAWLMANAGGAIAEAILRRFERTAVAVLCGPGNNGGDGFVVARRLAEAGWPVRVALLGDGTALKGDAASAAATWTGGIEPLDPAVLTGAGLVVDALFGAGLARPLDGSARTVLKAAEAAGVPICAADVPSGLDGDTGEPLGYAPRVALTVTFGRPKPAHLLLPGRSFCGAIEVADIGLPAAAIEASGSTLRVNDPALWRQLLPARSEEAHKYTFGHAVVLGGPATRSGAARLAARAALRAGAGLVTVACDADALPVYAATLTAVMVQPYEGDAGFGDAIGDERRNAVLLGPGGGVGETLRRRVLATLRAGKAAVLDADALTSFAERRAELFDALSERAVLTPHAGEFGRLFDDVPGRSKVERARAASTRSGAVVLLKGSDSVIAAPDGRAAIQPFAPGDLATAGTGDVLAGIVLGLLAQGVPAFEAACAGVWLHAPAAARFGAGLIAEDIEAGLPPVLREIRFKD